MTANCLSSALRRIYGELTKSLEDLLVNTFYTYRRHYSDQLLTRTVDTVAVVAVILQVPPGHRGVADQSKTVAVWLIGLIECWRFDDNLCRRFNCRRYVHQRSVDAQETMTSLHQSGGLREAPASDPYGPG